MKRSEVRTFLKAGADAIPIHFEAGRLTEFNSMKDKGYPFGWLATLKPDSDFGGSGSILIDDWGIEIHIGKMDRIDSVQDEYEAIVDECDLIAQKLIHQYNLALSGAGNILAANQDIYKLVSLSGFSREPFYKKQADRVTGVILTFKLNAPDKTNVC
jgi:hypothetical protein